MSETSKLTLIFQNTCHHLIKGNKKMIVSFQDAIKHNKLILLFQNTCHHLIEGNKKMIVSFQDAIEQRRLSMIENNAKFIDTVKNFENIMTSLDVSESNIKRSMGIVLDRNDKRKGEDILCRISEMKKTFRSAGNKYKKNTDNCKALLKIVQVMEIVPVFGNALIGVETLINISIEAKDAQDELICCIKMIFDLLDNFDENLKEFSMNNLEPSDIELKRMKKLLAKIEEGSEIVKKIERRNKFNKFFLAPRDKDELKQWQREVNNILKRQTQSMISDLSINSKKLLNISQSLKDLGYANLIVGTLTLASVAHITIIMRKTPQFVFYLSRMTKLSVNFLTKQILGYKKYMRKNGGNFVFTV